MADGNGNDGGFDTDDGIGQTLDPSAGQGLTGQKNQAGPKQYR